MTHVHLTQRLMKFLCKSDQNGLEIPGGTLNRKATNFMAYYPGWDKRVDAFTDSFDTIRTGVKSRHVHKNGVVLQQNVCQVFQVFHYLPAEEVGEGDRNPIPDTSMKKFSTWHPTDLVQTVSYQRRWYTQLPHELLPLAVYFRDLPGG